MSDAESLQDAADSQTAALLDIAAAIKVERAERKRHNRTLVVAIALVFVLLGLDRWDSKVESDRSTQRSEEAVTQRAETLRVIKSAEAAAQDTNELVEFVRDLQQREANSSNVSQSIIELVATLARCLEPGRSGAEREACFRAEMATTTTIAPVE